jgi:LPXTG-site transpeptidase (sortase) family protein
LDITKTDGGVSTTPGGTLTYTLTYHNTGAKNATGVSITETVPANTIFDLGHSSAGWSCPDRSPAGTSCTNAVGAVGASGSGSVTFVVTVTSFPGASVEQISNAASIGDDGNNGIDSTPDNNTSSDTTPLIAAPDLTITKSDGDITSTAGGSVTYTLSYRNQGTQDASGVLITETVPLHTTFKAQDPNGWSCSDGAVAGSTCTYSVGGLEKNASGSVTFVLDIEIPLDIGIHEVENTVSIADDGSSGVDLTPADNTASEPTPVIATPELSITKDDGGVTDKKPGDKINYTLSYENQGNQGATGVTITETVPANTIFAGTPGWICTASGTPCTASATGKICTCVYELAGVLDSGATGSVPFDVIILSAIPAGVDQISNTAVIADDGLNGTDPIPENNSSTDTTQLTATPDLQVTIDDGVMIVGVGQTLTYNLDYSNVGDQGSTGVTIVATFPPNTIFNASINPGWTVVAGHSDQVTYPLGSVPSGEGGEITLLLEVNSGGTTVDVSTIIGDDGSNGADPTPENNEDLDTDILFNITKTAAAGGPLHTSGSRLTVGELVNYETSIEISAARVESLVLIDILGKGLAFIDCLGIDYPPELVRESGTFEDACAHPTVTSEPFPDPRNLPINRGRRTTFTFGAVTNASGVVAKTLTVRYRAIVLDTSVNANGSILKNQAYWSWTGGASLAEVPMTVVESFLSLHKTVDKTTVRPGEEVVYTLSVAHRNDSKGDAFDVVLKDAIPDALTYVNGSLKFVSGQKPTTLTFTPPSILKVTWNGFARDGHTTILQFTAKIKEDAPTSRKITNIAKVFWSSLSGSLPVNPSPYNPLGTRRDYSPDDIGNGSAKDQDEIDPMENGILESPIGIAVLNVVSTNELPGTGFAPGRKTDLSSQASAKPFDSLPDVRVQIPALKLDAPLTGVPLSEEGWDLRWLTDQVGYLDGTAFPPEIGNSGLTAHVYKADGTPGPFVNLSTLKWGDAITIFTGNKSYVYEVRTVDQISPRAVSILRDKKDGYAWLTLLTCHEYNESSRSYKWRTAVQAVLISVSAGNVDSWH